MLLQIQCHASDLTSENLNRFCLLWYMLLICSILKNAEFWFTAGVPFARYFQVESGLANPLFFRRNVSFISASSAESLSARGVKSSRLLILQMECYLTCNFQIKYIFYDLSPRIF